MHEFRWLERIHMPPSGRLEDGMALANRLEWNITWAAHEDIRYVWTGETVIMRTDLREVAEAFVYGLSLAYSVLPDAVFGSLERNEKRAIEGNDIVG